MRGGPPLYVSRQYAGELMRQAGYDDAMIERVKKAVGKRGIKSIRNRSCWEDIATLSSLSITCWPSPRASRV